MAIPLWRYALKDFKIKKKKIKNLIKQFPLEKKGIQNFYSNTFLFSCVPYKHLDFKNVKICFTMFITGRINLNIVTSI